MRFERARKHRHFEIQTCQKTQINAQRVQAGVDPVCGLKYIQFVADQVPTANSIQEFRTRYKDKFWNKFRPFQTKIEIETE